MIKIKEKRVFTSNFCLTSAKIDKREGFKKYGVGQLMGLKKHLCKPNVAHGLDAPALKDLMVNIYMPTKNLQGSKRLREKNFFSLDFKMDVTKTTWKN